MWKYAAIYQVSVVLIAAILSLIEYAADISLSSSAFTAVGAVVAAIPAKFFVNDFKEPPTKSQTNRFALEVIAIEAAIIAFYVALFKDELLSEFSDVLNELSVSAIITIIVIALAISYLLLYFTFSLFAKHYAKEQKDKQE
ncbi:MAG: ABZJ_00895 family protein [Helicobacteraceae bacterium]|jgi:hypothetical protein|nr:ABZJ_00895 family protein [Helicobacteraceae bacterium]